MQMIATHFKYFGQASSSSRGKIEHKEPLHDLSKLCLEYLPVVRYQLSVLVKKSFSKQDL